MKKLVSIVMLSLTLLAAPSVAHQTALIYDQRTGKCWTIVYIDGQAHDVEVACPNSSSRA